MFNSEVQVSQLMRAQILRMLLGVYEQTPDILTPLPQIFQLFAESRTPPSENDIKVELHDLADDGLIKIEKLPWGESMADCGAKLTSKGRSFCQHGMPWNKVDEFAE